MRNIKLHTCSSRSISPNISLDCPWSELNMEFLVNTLVLNNKECKIEVYLCHKLVLICCSAALAIIHLALCCTRVACLKQAAILAVNEAYHTTIFHLIYRKARYKNLPDQFWVTYTTLSVSVACPDSPVIGIIVQDCNLCWQVQYILRVFRDELAIFITNHAWLGCETEYWLMFIQHGGSTVQPLHKLIRAWLTQCASMYCTNLAMAVPDIVLEFSLLYSIL